MRGFFLGEDMSKYFSSSMGFRGYCISLSGFSFFISWLLPNHSAPWLGFCQDIVSFFGVFLLALCVRGRVGFTWFEIFVVIVSFFPVLQWMHGIVWFRGDAVVYFFYVLVFAFSIFISRNLASEIFASEKILLFFFSVVLFASFLAVWISLRQWLQFDSSLWVVDLRRGGRPFANFAQPNNYASFLLLAVAGVAYLFDKRRIGGYVSCLLVLFLLFGVALSQSRTPFIGGFFAVAWAFWARGKVRVRERSVCLFFLVYISLFFAVPVLSDRLGIAASGALDRIGGMQRWDLWVQILSAIKDGPFWGYGWGQVSVAQMSVAAIHGGIPITEYSHNVFLDVLVWNGLVPGFFLWAVLCFFLVRLVIRGRSSEALFGFLAIGFFGVHSMLEYPFAYAFFLFPIGILLGVLEVEARSASSFSVDARYVHGLAVVSLGLLCYFGIEYLRVEEDYRLMRFESARIGSVVHDEIAPDVFFLDQVSGYIRFARTPATQGMSDDDIEFMRRISHRYPYSSSIFRYALALGLNGRASEAAHEMLILLNMYGDESYGEGVVALREMERQYPQLSELIAILPK